MEKTILITGGAGFIGSNFTRFLLDKYPSYKIIVLDALTYAGNTESLPVNINEVNGGRLSFWHGDIRNAELVDMLVSRSDVVVHFAAETHVTRSIYDNLHFFETDVLGTHAITNAVLQYKEKIERFIHISSSEVYGTAQKESIDEEHPLMPMSPYASAKTGADRLVYSYWATYGTPAVIIRPFNVYGPYQHLEKAIPRFITSCLLDEPLRVHGDGSASRDYLFVEDACVAIDRIMHADVKKISGEVFNVGSRVHRSMLSIAKDIVKNMARSEDLIEFVGERPGQVFRHTASTIKIKNMFGWEPRVKWHDGLKETIKWYEQNRVWWSKQLRMRSVPIVTKDGKKELH